MTSMRIATAVIALATALGCDQPAPEQVPTALVLTIAPMRAAYRTRENVQLIVTILDQNNAPIEDEGGLVEVSPASAATASGTTDTSASFMLSETGWVEFSACAPGASGDSPLCDSLRILVDDGSPVLELTEPSPGEELGGDGAADILVSGSVSDMRMSRVFVNGMLAEVDGLGAFTAHVPARFGVNHLIVEASDGVVTPVSVQMDVMWGDDYIPARTSWGAPGVSLPEGAVLDLGAGFFDDGAPLASRERPVMTEDLADLATLVIGEIDAASLLPPNPVVSGSALTLNIDDARLEGLSVEIQPDDGALDLFLRVSDLQVDTSGSLTVESTTRSLNGGIGVSLAGYVRVRVGRARLEDPIDVSLEELEVALERAEGRFDDPQVNAVFQLASGLLRTTLETQLHAVLDDLLAEAVPDLLRGIFVGLDTALNGQEVVLDTGVFPTITLLIDGQLATLTSRYGRGIEGVLQIDAGIDGEAIHPTSRGIALSAEEGGDPFFRSARMQLGVRLALLNGLLHALWDGGMLEIDASELLPDSISGLVSEAVLHGQMAPVIRAAAPGEEHDLVLSVGQLELDAVLSGDPVRYGMTLEAGIDLALVDNRLTLTIAETPFIRVWAMDTASERSLPAESLEELLLAMLWPSLRSSLADGLSLELPIPAPDALTELAPTLSGLSLSLSMTERISLRDETLVIEGGLMGVLP